MANHHRIKLQSHPSAYTANKVTRKTIVKHYKTLENRRKFLSDNHLCYDCRGLAVIVKAVAELNANGGTTQAVVIEMNTLYSLCILPALIPFTINGTTLWAYLDTGSGKNFISLDAVKRLKLNPVRYETLQINTLSGIQKQLHDNYPLFTATAS